MNMTIHQRRANLINRGFPLCQTVLAAFIVTHGSGVWSNPVGPQVINGQASTVTVGNQLSITNTPGAIINWQSFSINPGELMRFIQQSPQSSVLNRIVGQDPTQILGALQSNGKVFLINPNGIVFGAGARVDVNGLVASSLNLSNDDFLANKLNFSATGKAGAIQNEGVITTPSGGQVYLIAPNVTNSGLITSPNGDVMLAAGQSVKLADSTDPHIRVVVSAPSDQALNVGKVLAQGGNIGIYGALVNQQGLVSANSAVRGENGKIVFKASRDTLLEAGSVTSATGVGQGGEIQLLGDRVGLVGNAVVDASGQSGGGTVLVGGDYHGDTPTIQNAKRTFFGREATIRADAIQSGDGGKVIVWADESTKAYGTISARGGAQSGNGGFVETSGRQVLDFHAKVDVGAGKGHGGTLLLDPADISLIGGAGDGAIDGSSTFAGTPEGVGQLLFGDTVVGGSSIIYQSELQGLSPGTNIVLEASKSITATGTFDANQLTLPTDSSLTMRTRNASADAGGMQGIDLVTGTTGGPLAIVASGTGIITAQTGVGSSPLAADMKLSNLQTGGGSVTLNGSGNVSVGAIVTTPPGALGGAVSITAGTNGYLYLGGGIDTRPGAAGSNGNVTLSAGSYISSASASTIYANQLQLSAGAGIYGSNSAVGSTADGALKIQASSLNASNATSGDLRLSNSGSDLTVVDIGSVGYGVRQLGAGAISLDNDAGHAITVNGTVSDAGGMIRLTGEILSVNQPISAATVELVTDNLVLNGAITAAHVGVSAGSSHRPITVGSSVCNGGGVDCLRIYDLFNVNAPALTIGSNGQAIASGPLYVAGVSVGGTANTDRSANTTRLALLSDAMVSQGAPVAVQELAVKAGSIDLTMANQVSSFAAFSPASFAFTNTGDFTLSNLSGGGTQNSYNLQGASTTDAGIHLTSTTGSIALAATINAGPAGVTLIAGGAISRSAGTIIGASLEATAASGIGHGSALVTQVGSLTATNSGATTDISVTNTGELIVGNMAQSASGSTGNINLDNTGALVVANASSVSTKLGNILLVAHSPLTVDGTVISANGGAIRLEAGASGSANDKLMVSSTGVVSTTGLVQLKAGDAIIVSGNVPNGATLLPNQNTPPPPPPPPPLPEPQPPSLSDCVTNPSLSGCAAVLPSLAICTSAPTTAGCSAVLPSLAVCTSAPTTVGCSAVLPSVVVCITAPTTVGCSAVLPSLAICATAPTTAGCSAVLPSLTVCITAPTTAGCSAVLPSVVVCATAPTTAGCSAVLPSLAICTTAPTTAGCSAVLPSLAICTTAPTTAGCSAVLPSLATCTATPTAAGCSAVLPTLAECTTTPTLAGCATVLPPVNVCLSNPSAAGCAVVLPPATNQTTEPVAQAISNTVNIINTVTTTIAPAAPAFVSTAAKVTPPPAPTPAPTSTSTTSTAPASAAGPTDGKTGDKKEEKKEEKVSEKSEAKNEPPPPKTFCN